VGAELMGAWHWGFSPSDFKRKRNKNAKKYKMQIKKSDHTKGAPDCRRPFVINNVGYFTL